VGDKILKKILLLAGIVSLLMSATINGLSQKPQINIEKYNTIFKQIETKRVGPSDVELSMIYNPFVNQHILKIIKDKNVTKFRPVVLQLYGIINNRAKINKKWYKLRSKVYDYKLIKIKDISVILKKNRKKIELFLRKKNDKIKITKNF